MTTNTLPPLPEPEVHDAALRSAVDALAARAERAEAARPAQLSDQKCLPDGIRYKLPPLVLSGHQLRDALEFLAPDGTDEQLEQCVCIAERDNIKHEDDDGPTEPPGLFCWLEEYPEEGCIPLDGKSRPAGTPAEAAQRVPDGWRLVPVGPTGDMLIAGSNAASGYGSPLTRTECAYHAMLAAAPEAPQAAQRVPLTDERIEHLWDIHVGDPTPKYPITRKDVLVFARAVLAAAPTATEPKGGDHGR